MSLSNITIGLLALALVAALYGIHSYRQDVQRLHTELTITRADLTVLQTRLAAIHKAESELQQAQEEINNVANKRERLLDQLPSGWGNSPLPDECVRMFKYDPAAEVGSRLATGEPDARD